MLIITQKSLISKGQETFCFGTIRHFLEAVEIKNTTRGRHKVAQLAKIIKATHIYGFTYIGC